MNEVGHVVKLLLYDFKLEFFDLVSKAIVVLWVQVLDDRLEDVCEHFVGLLIASHDTYWILRLLNATLNAQLNVSALGSASFLHVGPDFSSQVFFQQAVAVLVELGESDDWNALRHGSSHHDAIFVKFLLCH